MCPSGLALHHPATETLLNYATKGYPTNTGKPWTREETEAAIARGPHVSALDPAAMKQLVTEIMEKVKQKQYRLVKWDDRKVNPPEQLILLPIVMIPHKSRLFRAILDLSFSIRLANGNQVPAWSMIPWKR